jgi:hypothetical protein
LLHHLLLPPCCAGHFGWEFLKYLQTQPTYNCTTAWSAHMYSNYRGGLSFADLSNRTLYVNGLTNGTYGYYPQACSTGYNWICEVGGVAPCVLASCFQWAPAASTVQTGQLC